MFLRKVGVTPDGKNVLAGVYRMFETEGLPLDVLIDALRRNNCVCSWLDFREEALAAGMAHERIISKAREALVDVYGAAYADAVVALLSRA